ncbi:MAG: SDR family oxidoreductase [Acidobacteria bacterium]|nr:SDR family oxidoreductase [Acidobacteriota bacterium]MDA1235411.1 SDR family oxidoreductase [Acidobacteriota bacterium]
MRVLISGGAGFVASHLADRWIADGHDVIAVDNLITGRRANIAHLLENPAFTYIQQDICDPLQIDGRLDGVFHMASPASPFDYLAHPIETMLVNSVGTKRMLDLARAQNARYLLASTSECYGDPLEHPQRETYWGNVNPIGPRAVYDEAKRFAEAMTMSYHREYGVDTKIVRIFNTYGPRMKLDDGRVVPAFLDQALNGRPITIFGDGSQTRSFCYVSDLVDGLTRLILSEEHEPVNIGNPTELTILEFAEVIQKLVGSSCAIERQPLPKDDPKQRKPDITKAKERLGWEPGVSLADGLAATVEFFRAQQAVAG